MDIHNSNKKKQKISCTIYKRRANGNELSFDTAVPYQWQNLKYISLNKEKTMSNKKRMLVISNPGSAEIHKEFWESVKDTLVPPEVKDREGVREIQIEEFIRDKKLFERVKLKLEKFTPTTLQGLTIEELERAYRSSVFEQTTDGNLHCYLYAQDERNWCFLVPVVSGQQLMLLPIITEEEIKYLVDAQERERTAHDKRKKGLLDEYPWLLPSIMIIVGVIIILGTAYFFAPRIMEGVAKASATTMETVINSFVDKVTIHIGNATLEATKYVLEHYSNATIITQSGTITTTTIPLPPHIGG